MAKASKRRAGKKRKAKKAAGKKVRERKASRKRAAPLEAKRKAAKARRAKPKSKRKPARKAAAMMPPSKSGEAWPMIFAVVVALIAGIAVMWHFGGITIAAAATMPLQMLATPIANAAYVGCDVIASADTWLALAHPTLLPIVQ